VTHGDRRALEIFVNPGFGIAGPLGIAALVSGLTLSVIGAGATQTVVHAAPPSRIRNGTRVARGVRVGARDGPAMARQ
jgi:hypothetical protein